MGLRNDYLEETSKFLLKHRFLGVFPYDLFPINVKMSKKPVSFIINLDKSSDPGSHFVCIYIDKEKLEYMDSYGMEPFLPRIKNFVRTQAKKKKYIFNEKMIQKLDSRFCGYYCLGFLLSKDLKMSMKKFISNFPDVLHNDKKIERFILKCIDLY